MSRFVHLHTHSHYSFLQALPKVPELVAQAKTLGMDALALTDAGNLHGAIEFYKEARAAGVHPVIGVDAYLARGSRFEKERESERRARLVLFAENNAGYKNLLYLVTKSFTEGFSERPRMDKELLKERGGGLIALIPSFAGDVAQFLRAGDREGAGAALAEYANIFGGDNVFLEVTHHPTVAGHEDLMRAVIALAKETGTPVVAQQDVYYLASEDREATEVLRRIQREGEHGRNEAEDFSFLSAEKIEDVFGNVPDAVQNSGNIAARCAVSLELGSWVFPDFPVPEGSTHEKELRAKVYGGIRARGLGETPELKTRIEYELGIIIGKGFAPYFLVVSDLLTFAKREGILTTTRGSAAGSIVAYLTGITNVSPLTYKLPFERFLNPERPKAPDIDMDFADNRRDEMIAYAKRTYGEDKVAQIGTFGTMMARAAARDVARALGHAYATGDRIAKLIPIGQQGFPMTIDRAFTEEPDLKSLYDADEDVREILDVARRIEGCVRHVGVHAAGVVIAPTPLVEWTPLQFDPKGGKLITQYDMHAVEDAGLLKFDFLGIKNLSILADSVARARAERGAVIDIENVPLNDAKTYAMLAAGETEGVFQLNGSGITRFLKELRPTTIHDINAMVALYRPGPMEVIPAYIARKNNASLVKYPDPRMEKFLKESYGLLVYQDDLLYSAVELAGYSWLEVDKFRKAIGKKIPAEMAAQKEKFVAGIVENGQTEAFANKLWQLFEPFQAYGFNKAHAASYGKVAYQTAYMKANFPVEYMAALLTADSGDTESIALLVAECERLGIDVLAPDVNESRSNFTIVGERRDAIRFGLASIKNFGAGISEAIIAERESRGPFKSLADFLSRIDAKGMNRKGLEALAKCGALDAFSERGVILANIETLLAFHKDATASATQDSLFSAKGVSAFGGGSALPPPEVALVPADAVSLSDKLAWEKELLGIYVSGHPLDAFEEVMKKARIGVKELREDPRPGITVVLPALVSEARIVLTKSGEKMAFLKLEDKTGAIEAVVFPKLFKQHSGILAPGSCVLAKAKVANRNGELSLALEEIRGL